MRREGAAAVRAAAHRRACGSPGRTQTSGRSIGAPPAAHGESRPAPGHDGDLGIGCRRRTKLDRPLRHRDDPPSPLRPATPWSVRASADQVGRTPRLATRCRAAAARRPPPATLPLVARELVVRPQLPRAGAAAGVHGPPHAVEHPDRVVEPRERDARPVMSARSRIARVWRSPAGASEPPRQGGTGVRPQAPAPLHRMRIDLTR